MLLCMDLIGYHGAKVSGPLLRNHDLGGQVSKGGPQKCSITVNFSAINMFF